MDSLTFQLYALERGIDLGTNVDGDLASAVIPNLATTKEEKAKKMSTSQWADSETDSSDEEDEENIEALKQKLVRDSREQSHKKKDAEDASDSEDEEVGGLEKAVGWLGHSDDDDDYEDSSDDDGTEAASESNTVASSLAVSAAESSSKSNETGPERSERGAEKKAASETKCRITELLPFFKSPKLEVRSAVATHVAGLTTTVEGRSLVNSPLVMQHLCRLLGGDDKEAKPALQALINMCELRVFKRNLTRLGIVKRLVSSILDESQRALLHYQCMLLANVTQDVTGASDLMGMRLGGGAPGAALGKIVRVLLRYYPANVRVSNDSSQDPCYLAHILINVTQLPEGRAYFLSDDSSTTGKSTTGDRSALVDLLSYSKSSNAVLRQGLVGFLKNLCHEIRHLPYLLGNEIDALGRVLRLLNAKESNESVWILAIDFLAVIVATDIGKTCLRENKTFAELFSAAAKCAVVPSLPQRTRTKLAQIALIVDGKAESVRMPRDVKPGDVIEVGGGGGMLL
eukprot:g2042.t1